MESRSAKSVATVDTKGIGSLMVAPIQNRFDSETQGGGVCEYDLAVVNLLKFGRQIHDGIFSTGSSSITLPVLFG